MKLLSRFPCVTILDDQGVKYLHRYYIFKSRLLSIYVHEIMHDDDADMHDHPWPFAILILKQGYREVMPACTKIRKPFDVFAHLPTCRHRIELIDGTPSWSLVIMGPKLREWGFHTKTGWVHFKCYVGKIFQKDCQ